MNLLSFAALISESSRGRGKLYDGESASSHLL
jgi:hypothetical protein